MDPANVSDAPDSLLLSGLNRRQAKYRRNEKLDALLAELATLLEPAERAVLARLDTPTRPALLVVGNPRSGTTAFMQWLAATGLFAVPSNLLSRFYYAPYIGAKIQQLLCDPAFAYKDELGELTGSSGAMASELGKTKGALSPSEFFHFWRRFLPNYDPGYLTPELLAHFDAAGLRKGIASIEEALGRPFAAKAIMMQYNLTALAEAVRNVVFIHIRRHPLFVMQSVLEARESFYGDRTMWWSVKPQEFAKLRDLGPFEQIAGQVYYTERSLEEQARELPSNRWLTVDYECFCENPAATLAEIRRRFEWLDCPLPDSPAPQAQLRSSNAIRLPETDIQQLIGEYQKLSRSELTLLPPQKGVGL